MSYCSLRYVAFVRSETTETCRFCSDAVRRSWTARADALGHIQFMDLRKDVPVRSIAQRSLCDLVSRRVNAKSTSE